MIPHSPSDSVRVPSGLGYAHPHYAASLDEFGDVCELSACRGSLLVRPVPHSSGMDGTGCYPLFCCGDWNALHEDLEGLAERLVCVSLVTDPFAAVELPQLQTAFPDVCCEYKQHFVTDLSKPLETILGSHHRRNVRKALASLDVRQATSDGEFASHWQRHYDNLARRHGIEGIARFSPEAFRRQMAVPGFTAFSAFDGSENCGATLWYVCGDVAYYHLGAYSDRGYGLGASFALFWTALSQFAKSGVRWAALGAGAGATPSESGLTRFKQGWATHTRPVYFCGRILQPEVYGRLASKAAGAPGYFPAYRRPCQPTGSAIAVA